MKKMTVSLITIMTSLALTSPIYAAGDSQTTTSNPTTMTQQKDSQFNQSQARSARDLLGMDIVSRTGENIGEIQDIKIDTDTGRISYVTVQKGGVLGIGGEEGIAVPLEAFSFGKDNAKLLVDQSKLDNAPKQANMNDEEFRRGLDSHYGVSPSWQDKGHDSRQESQHMNMNPDSNNMGNHRDQKSNQQ